MGLGLLEVASRRRGEVSKEGSIGRKIERIGVGEGWSIIL